MVGAAIGARVGARVGARIGTGPGQVPASEFVAAGAPQASTGAVTVPWPSAHRIGDVGILIVAVKTGSTALTSAQGFVEIANSPQTSTAATATKLAVYQCRATSGAMASPVLGDVANDHTLAVILTFRRCVAAGDPIDVSAGDSTGASASTSVTVPGATTTKDNELIVAVCTQGVDAGSDNVSGWTNANLVGLTELLDLATAIGSGGGIGVAAGVMRSAGAYGNTTATLATTSGQGRISFALRPTA